MQCLMKNNNCGTVCIAGVNFALQYELPMLNEFVCHLKEKSDGHIFRMSNPIFDGTEKLVAEHEEINVYIRNDGSWLYVMPRCRDNVQVSLSADYREISYYIPRSPDESIFDPILRGLLRTAFECVCVNNSCLSLHSACVDVCGEAVAFTGVSGLGKSTRAGAWVEANSAEFISGDRPTLRINFDDVTVYGVPWDGKEQIFRSVQRPLKAVLEVRRSDSVYLRKLDPVQAQKLLIKQVFVPMWDTHAAVKAIMNVKKLANTVPVYRLFCGPDAESAKKAYDILFDNPNKILEAAADMKIKEGFVLRKVAGEYIVMPTGSNIAKFDGAIALNDVSAFLFEQLKNPVSKEDLLTALLNEYEVDKETAANDIDAIVLKFAEMGIIE